jgi:hypothetical protein
MGFAEMYVKWVDKYVEIIDGVIGSNKAQALNPFLSIARNNLVKSKVRA